MASAASTPTSTPCSGRGAGAAIEPVAGRARAPPPAFSRGGDGAGTPAGVGAELIAAALNVNCGGRHHVGLVVERQIARWASEAFGFPSQSSGVFVTGTSQANFLGLLIA